MLFYTWSLVLLLGESCEFSEWLAVCRSGGVAFVSVVKPADLRKRYDSALVWCLNRACDWAVHLKRQMRAARIVISDVVSNDPSKMIFAEDDDVVQTLSPYTAVESFRIRILPGTMRRREDFFDAHVFDASTKPVAVDAIAVAQQVPRHGVPWKCLHDVLCRPRCSRMFRHSEVNDVAALDR